MKPTIALVTAVWGRPRLTEYVLGYYQQVRAALQGQLDLRLLAVGSEGAESRELCERHGFEYLEFPNQPLNYKWNAVVQAARRHAPHAVVIVGSDDLISSEYFPAAAERVRQNKLSVLGLRDLYFLNLQGCRLAYWHAPDGRETSAVGLGRCFPSAVLDQVDWAPWSVDVPRQRGLDASCTRKLAAYGIGFSTCRMEELGVVAIDVKGGTNVNSWDVLRLGTGLSAAESRILLAEFGFDGLCRFLAEESGANAS